MLIIVIERMTVVEIQTIVGFAVLGSIYVMMMGGPKKLWFSWLFNNRTYTTGYGILNLADKTEDFDGYVRNLSEIEFKVYEHCLSKERLDYNGSFQIFSISHKGEDTKIRMVDGVIFNIRSSSKYGKIPQGECSNYEEAAQYVVRNYGWEDIEV